MGVIVVQIGQCGNQIGTKLFSVLQSDAEASCRQGGHSFYRQSVLDKFFTTSAKDEQKPPLAKAVLIDMEPKAIQASFMEARKSGSWLYNPSSTYRGNRGSGNNWANGYYCQGPKATEQVSDLIQREVEKCNDFEGFVILMSVAGGTGSGMGAYITELLRDEYPNAVRINPVIWPYASGEVILQNYNALLTTSHLSESSDAVVYFLNDHLHQVGSKSLRLKEVSFGDLNKIASHSIASILQPAVPISITTPLGVAETTNRLAYRYCSLHDLCTQLTPHSSYRFLTVKTVPQIPEASHVYTCDLWPSLLKRLKQMLVTDSPTDDGMDWSLKSHPHRVKSLANLLIMRGKGAGSISSDGFTDPELYCDWIPEFSRCQTWTNDVSFNKYEKTCSLVSNNSSCQKPVGMATERAWQMYSAKAYVHQYHRFGLSDEHFMEAFVRAEQILKDYSVL